MHLHPLLLPLCNLSNLPPQSNEPDHFPFELYTMQFSLKFCHYSTPTLSGVFPQNLYLVTCPPQKKTFEELQRYVTGSQPSSFFEQNKLHRSSQTQLVSFSLETDTCTFSHIQPHPARPSYKPSQDQKCPHQQLVKMCKEQHYMPSQQQPAKILSEENRLYLMVKDFSQLLRNEWLTEKHINPLSTNGISFDSTITGPFAHLVQYV